MRKYLFKITGISLAIIICVSFIKNNNKMETAKGKWISLFDGKTFDGWHNFNKTGSVTGWDIEDGSMVCLGAGANGGDIVTNAAYENFELKWEWKISKEGNSGVLYHVVEDAKYSGPYQTGPEYQLIDDVGFPQKLEEWQKTGADYAMNVPNESKKLKPVGEWNTSKIVFNKGHVEHWLNEAKIVEFQAWDAEWTKKKTTGKWKDYPDYGLAKTGLIALQDHGHKTFFKNIMIKEL
jgi:hypothetical protein